MPSPFLYIDLHVINVTQSPLVASSFHFVFFLSLRFIGISYFSFLLSSHSYFMLSREEIYISFLSLCQSLLPSYPSSQLYNQVSLIPFSFFFFFFSIFINIKLHRYLKCLACRISLRSLVFTFHLLAFTHT